MKVIGIEIKIDEINIAYIEGDENEIKNTKSETIYSFCEDLESFADKAQEKVKNFIEVFSTDKFYILDFDITAYSTFGEFYNSSIYYIYWCIKKVLTNNWCTSGYLVPPYVVAEFLNPPEGKSIEEFTLEVLNEKEKFINTSTALAVALAGLKAELKKNREIINRHNLKKIRKKLNEDHWIGY